MRRKGHGVLALTTGRLNLSLRITLKLVLCYYQESWLPTPCLFRHFFLCCLGDSHVDRHHPVLPPQEALTLGDIRSLVSLYYTSTSWALRWVHPKLGQFHASFTMKCQWNIRNLKSNFIQLSLWRESTWSHFNFVLNLPSRPRRSVISLLY